MQHHFQGLSLKGSRAGTEAAPSPGTGVGSVPLPARVRRRLQTELLEGDLLSWRRAGAQTVLADGGVSKEEFHSGDRALLAVLPWNRHCQICQTSRLSDSPVKYQSCLAVRVCWHSFQGIRRQQ